MHLCLLLHHNKHEHCRSNEISEQSTELELKLNNISNQQSNFRQKILIKASKIQRKGYLRTNGKHRCVRTSICQKLATAKHNPKEFSPPAV
jgi:hypothetical protein